MRGRMRAGSPTPHLGTRGDDAGRGGRPRRRVPLPRRSRGRAGAHRGRLAGRRRPRRGARPGAAGAAGIPASYYLGVLGMPGLTAWAGCSGGGVPVRRGRSSSPALPAPWAAWSASSPGCAAPAVVGSAGSPEKVPWLIVEFGFTGAFDYHDARSPSCSGSGTRRHRRLLRQRRWRAPRGRGRCARPARPRRRSAGRSPLQRGRATPGPANIRCSSATGSPCAASSSATTPTCGREFLGRQPGGSAPGTRRPRDRSLGARQRRPGVPRPPARREHREDGRPPGADE